MKLNCIAAGMLFATLCASQVHAGDALIDLDVAIGGYHGSTDQSGSFTVTGLKPGQYDVVLTGNPIKSVLGSDGGRISLKVDGKRYPVTCTYAACKASAVPIKANTKGIATLSN